MGRTFWGRYVTTGRKNIGSCCGVRINRTFVAVRGGGGGNRAPGGMDANSILFIVLATCKVQKKRLIMSYGYSAKDADNVRPALWLAMLCG